MTDKSTASAGRRRHPLYERLHNSKATLAKVPRSVGLGALPQRCKTLAARD
jgi:hypothetical protein